ncbi:MAG: hypothetical protein RL367_691 [Pseudomonadota bacterium]
MAKANVDPVIDSPTYMGNIRYFFSVDDIDHMGKKGIDLGSYNGVKAHAVQIYSAVVAGQMPPKPAIPWSANRSQTFLNWMKAGYPMGQAPAAGVVAFQATQPGARVRKDVANLTDAEAQLLTKAFQGLMDLDVSDPENPNGYFALAGLHGLPKLFCQHHNDPFNPWHRIYLKMFEDALRSVDGCGDVTLPYWDISKPIPKLLKSGLFSAYTFPGPIGIYNKGDKTQRYTQTKIDGFLKRFDFFGDTDRSMAQNRWGTYVSGGQTGSGYQQFSIQAHDSGHLATGPTMADQSVASYDPIFWFYHCNLDRFWLSWQEKMHAMDWTSFQSLLDNSLFWTAPLNVVEPFNTTTDQTIAFGVVYEEPMMAKRPLETMVRTMEATRGFQISSASEVAVRVENIERINVPGSFVVNLLANGKPIASRAFFQPADPGGCKTCVTIPKIGLEFRVPQALIMDKKLSVAIEVPSQKDIGAGFPLSGVGQPTIKVSLLLDEV